MSRRGIFEQVEFLPDQLIFTEGEPGDAMYLIEKGVIKIWTMRDDRSVVLANLSNGAVFGEMALINDIPRIANATAGSHGCSAVKITKTAFQQRMDRSDPMVKAVARLLIEHLRNANARVIALSQKLKMQDASNFDNGGQHQELIDRCRALEHMVVKLKKDRQELLKKLEK